MQFVVSEISPKALNLHYKAAKAGNSFSISTALELQTIMQSPELKQAEVIAFSSEGSRFFCTGGNLKHYAQQQTKDEGLRENETIGKILDAFSELSALKIAVVDGDAFGGGMEFLSCFDYVLSCPHSYFGFWQRRLSLTTGWGGARLWQKRLGGDVLKSAVASAQSFGAHEALRLGFIDEVLVRSLMSRRVTELIVHHQSWPLEPMSFMSEYPANEDQAFSDLWFSESHLAKLKK